MEKVCKNLWECLWENGGENCVKVSRGANYGQNGEKVRVLHGGVEKFSKRFPRVFISVKNGFYTVSTALTITTIKI